LLPLGKARRASVCRRRRDEGAQHSRRGRARHDFRVRRAEESARFVCVLWGADQQPARLRQSCAVSMCELEFALEVALEPKHDRRWRPRRDKIVVVRCAHDQF